VRQFLVIFLLAFFMWGCTTSKVIYAPVSDAASIEPIPKKGFHKVKKGETIYAVAWRYGLDYRYVARRNQMTLPYRVHPQQKIFLVGHPKKSLPPPVEKHELNAPVKIWTWPAKGPLLNRFSDTNKGLNIGGQMNDAIFATAGGRVVYSGDGLRNYGNLIIIKHNSLYLSAYAHNSKLLVKEGDWVKPRQKIAEMGNSGTRRVMLYFEIRRSGKPVNPLEYLTN